jgi:hypothetical protein
VKNKRLNKTGIIGKVKLLLRGLYSLFRCNAIPVIALHFLALEPVANVGYVRIAQGESLCQRPAKSRFQTAWLRLTIQIKESVLKDSFGGFELCLSG